MRILAIFVLLASFVVTARADNIPVYDLNQGSVFSTFSTLGVVNYSFSFTGPGGASLNGFIQLPVSV